MAFPLEPGPHDKRVAAAPPSPSSSKPEWRRWARQVRSSLPVFELSRAMSAHLAELLARRELRHVLLYSAFGHEPDPAGVQELWPGQYYLPRTEGAELRVHPLPAPLVRHRFGFLEPSPTAPQADPGVLEVVVLPGLAFDSRGYRLGYGQGFYDRFLPTVPQALRIGFVPQALIVPTLPTDPWDLPAHYLVSEQGVTACYPHTV